MNTNRARGALNVSEITGGGSRISAPCQYVNCEFHLPVRLKIVSVATVAQKGTRCPVKELKRASATGMMMRLYATCRFVNLAWARLGARIFLQDTCEIGGSNAVRHHRINSESETRTRPYLWQLLALTSQCSRARKTAARHR